MLNKDFTSKYGYIFWQYCFIATRCHHINTCLSLVRHTNFTSLILLLTSSERCYLTALLIVLHYMGKIQLKEFSNTVA